MTVASITCIACRRGRHSSGCCSVTSRAKLECGRWGGDVGGGNAGSIIIVINIIIINIITATATATTTYTPSHRPPVIALSLRQKHRMSLSSRRLVLGNCLRQLMRVYLSSVMQEHE